MDAPVKIRFDLLLLGGLLVLLMGGDLANAGLERYCPHWLPGPYTGVCGRELMRYVKKLCRLSTTGRIAPSASSAPIAIDQLPSILRTGSRLFQLQTITNDTLLTTLRFPQPPGAENNGDDDDLVINVKVAKLFGNALIDKSGAQSLLRSKRQLPGWVPQNIICECCYHVCKVQEALEYCWNNTP